MLKDMPSAAKKLSPDQQKDLAKKTENRIAELLRKAKKLGYELESECVSTKWIGNGHMELHLNSGSSEVDRTVWGNNGKIGSYNETLGKELDDFIDDNEGEYKDYLTKRVKAKWLELESLTKTETINLDTKGKQNLTETERKQIESEKQQMLYGIGLLEEMIDNFRESEGDSWLDDDDKILVQIKKLIRNAKVSINNSQHPSKQAIIKNFIDPIREKRRSFKNIQQTIQTSGGVSYKNPAYEQHYNYLNTIFFGDENQQISAIREFGGGIIDKTETSFLSDKILEKSIHHGGLRVENQETNKCIDRIESRFSRSIYVLDSNGEIKKDSNDKPIINESVKKEYDYVLSMANDGFKSNIVNYFVSKDMLPKNREGEKDEVYKCIEKWQEQLKGINRQVDNFSETPESLKQKQHMEKLKLEQKENKTEDDIKALQVYAYLEEHPKINEATIEGMKNEIKYGNLAQISKICFFPSLVELGGGAKGANSSIYNDIIGYGTWNLSDENAKLAGEITAEIAITVAVAVVTGGVGGAIIGTGLRGAALAARGARWINVAKNIYRIVKITEKGYKALNILGQATKLGIHATGLLIEGTVFNAASTVVHSATHGTSLDRLNLNPIAKENIQTAAFLGALSIAGNFTQGLMKVGGRTKVSLNLQKGIKAAGQRFKEFSTGLVAEMGSMLAAEQAINFTFGHDVIDPETGEVVTSHAPTLPTQQELIQMVGMILAFKAVKPGLWQKYEKKLNDGTLEICRSVKENEIIIKDIKTGKTEKIQELIDGKTNNNIGTKNRIDNQHNNHGPTTKEDLNTKKSNPANRENKQEINREREEINREREEINREREEINREREEINREREEINREREEINREREEINREREEISRKKEMHEKRKPELERKKAELERRRQQLLRQRETNWRSLDGQENGIGKLTDILKKGNIITIDGFKYQFTGIKNGKAEFIIDPTAKKSAQQSGKFFSERVEVSSLKELLDSRFNLEPGQKRTNSGRYNKLNELINDKIEPLDRLQNKIRNKKSDIARLEEEIARLERGNNTIAKNDYFEQHKNEIVGRNVRIDGVKYRAEHINGDGTLQFKEVDGNKNFTISSFKQLAEKGQVNGFSDGLLADGSPKRGSGELTKSEIDNHQTIRNLISGEKGYLESRNISETIKQKKLELQTSQRELKGLEDKLSASRTRQNTIDERARKGEEINKELRQVETEIERVNSEISEADRLTKKYREELDGKAVTENEKKEEIKEEKETLSTEIKNEIKDKIPDLLKNEHISSINSEFSNNPELHKNFIETKIIKKLLNYVENITKSGRNPDLIEVLKLSKEELNNIQYEQKIEIINKIDTYLKSVETATKFINIQKSGGVTAKELFLRAKGLDTSKIKNFEGNVTIEQFRNSIVFIFEKASDVQRFFGHKGNGSHFENKIPGLDTIIINKENCKNAEKIGLKEEDAISRVIQHESQHAINEIFMPKDIRITHKEAMNPTITDINISKKYALNRVKNEIVAQYTNRLIKHRLSSRTIEELSKGIGIKKFLTNPENGGVYDYFGNRKNTPEGKKAREEYKKEVEQMCDYIDETLKSCKSNEEIQDMLNMFCTTDVKERKNIKDIVKSKEQQQKTQQRRQTKEQKRTQEKNEIEDVQFTEEEINTLNEMLDKYKNTKSDDIPLADRQKVLNIIKNKYDIKETEKKANELKNYIEDFFESDFSNKIDVIDFGDYETTKNLAGRLTKFLEKKYGLPELNVILHNQEAGRFGVSNKNEIHLNTNSRNGSNNRDVLDFFVNIYSHEFCHTLDAYGKGSLNPQINELGSRFYVGSGDYYYNNPVEIVARHTGEIVSGKKGYGSDGMEIIGERFSEKIKKSLAEEIDKMGTEGSTDSQEQERKLREEQERRLREGQEKKQIEDQQRKEIEVKSKKETRDINHKIGKIISETLSREGLKFDWVPKKSLYNGEFLKGVRTRYNKIIQQKNIHIPKEFFLNMRSKLGEMIGLWKKKINYYHERFINKFNISEEELSDLDDILNDLKDAIEDYAKNVKEYTTNHNDEVEVVDFIEMKDASVESDNNADIEIISNENILELGELIEKSEDVFNKIEAFEQEILNEGENLYNPDLENNYYEDELNSFDDGGYYNAA